MSMSHYDAVQMRIQGVHATIDKLTAEGQPIGSWNVELSRLREARQQIMDSRTARHARGRLGVETDADISAAFVEFREAMDQRKEDLISEQLAVERQINDGT
jgi:hypothetical protein